MAEIHKNIEFPTWIKRIWLLATIAALAMVSAACDDAASTTCDEGSVVTLNYQTDDLSEMLASGVVKLDVPDCPMGVDLDLLDSNLESKLNNDVPESLSIGRRTITDYQADLGSGRRYINLRDIPSELDVVVLDDADLALVPIPIEGITSEGVPYHSESLIVLDDLLGAINSSLFNLSEVNQSGVSSGTNTNPEKQTIRNNSDAIVFALACTGTLFSLLFGVQYFKDKGENRRRLADISARENNKSSSSWGQSDYVDYRAYNDSYVNGPYKAGDVIRVESPLSWNQLSHAKEMAELKAGAIRSVLSVVGFTNKDFDAEARKAIESADAMAKEYGKMWDGRDPIKIVLTEAEASRINTGIRDADHPDPTQYVNIASREGAGIILGRMEKTAENIGIVASSVKSAGAGTIGHMNIVAAENNQAAKSIENIEEFSREIRTDYRNIDAAHAAAERHLKSIPPDNVE